MPAVGDEKAAVATGPRRRGIDDRFIFPASLRWGGVVALALSVPLCAVLVWSVPSQRAYLSALAAVTVAYAVPGLAIAVVASLRAAPGDRHIVAFWAAAFALGSVSLATAVQRTDSDWTGLARWSLPAAIGLFVCLFVSDTQIMRARSGQRAAIVDAGDLFMATLSVVVPVALVVADRIAATQHAWFTVSAALWGIGGCHAVLLSLVLRSRVERQDRTVANIGVALGVSVFVGAGAQVVQGLHDFRLQAGPFVASYALAIGMATMFFLWARRRPSRGLERLPPGAQVRRHSGISVLVVVAVPVISMITWVRRDDAWVVTTALVAVSSLLFLSSLRHQVTAGETARLHALVDAAARERGQLLADVMAHVDADRHRVAAHLHRQVVALHTAMAAFTSPPEPDGRRGGPTTATFVADRLRTDLRQQIDALSKIAIGVTPLARPNGVSHRLAAPVRAYVEGLYGDAPRPVLRVEVDDELVLDWATEAILLRIVQEAIHRVWRHGVATSLDVTIAVSAGVVVVEVVDDGDGHLRQVAGPDVDAMRTLANFAGGTVHLSSRPGRGTTVRAELRHADLRDPPPRPRLRLVEDR